MWKLITIFIWHNPWHEFLKLCFRYQRKSLAWVHFIAPLEHILQIAHFKRVVFKWIWMCQALFLQAFWQIIYSVAKCYVQKQMNSTSEFPNWPQDISPFSCIWRWKQKQLRSVAFNFMILRQKVTDKFPILFSCRLWSARIAKSIILWQKHCLS